MTGSARRHFHAKSHAIQCRHLHGRPKGGFGHGQRHLQDNVVALAPKISVWPNTDFDVQILAARALTCKAHGLAFGHARGYANVDVLAIHIEANRAASGRRLQRDGHLWNVLWRRSGRGLTASPAAAASKSVAEARKAAKLTEKFFKLSWIDLRALPGPAAPVKCCAAWKAASCGSRPGTPNAVVLLAFFFVAEDVVGVLNLLEARFGLLVAGIAIGMMLARQFAIRLFDFVVRGVFGYAQDFIVIARHGRITSSELVLTAPPTSP